MLRNLEKFNQGMSHVSLVYLSPGSQILETRSSLKMPEGPDSSPLSSVRQGKISPRRCISPGFQRFPGTQVESGDAVLILCVNV